MIFFHDDPDGFCSFLLLYKFIGDGRGFVVKTTPRITEKFVRQVEMYQPDKVIIVDIAVVEQEFIDSVKVPIVWIDHHQPLKRHGVKYYNPREIGKKVPASYVRYQITQENVWLGMCGTVGDWHMPDFRKDFVKEYPDLLGKDVKKAQDALYNSKLGKLVKIIAFLLRGQHSDVRKCIKIMTRIKDPYEILDGETSSAKFLHKRYNMVNSEYEDLLKSVKVPKDKLLVFTYTAKRMSLSGELANELLYKHPDKVVIIAREKSGEFKCSLRSPLNIKLNKILEKALEGLEGFGGGHEHACGAVVKKEDFDEFIERIRQEIA